MDSDGERTLEAMDSVGEVRFEVIYIVDSRGMVSD